MLLRVNHETEHGSTVIRPWARPGHLFLWLMLLPALAGCASNPGPPYPYAVITGGGPEGWPVWVEDLIFDGYVNIGGGSIGGRMTWDEAPDDGALTVMGHSSIPRTVSARWFSHRTLTFYEIELTLPEGTKEQVRAFYQKHPPSDYRHALMIHISGDGGMRLWWRAMCRGFCGDDPAYLPIIKEAVGQQVDGDPARYANRTAQQRERGRIPPAPEPPPR